MSKFIDLFCGIGGFRVALEREGMECVFSCDIDEDVCEAYYQNFKDRPRGDITKIKAKEIPDHDILCAGFPCQPFSIAGKRKGMREVNNGRLFYEIIRIAEAKGPVIMLLENVKNILSIDNGNVIKTLEAKLNEIGYKVEKHVLNASYFGIPQARERVYFVCLRKDAQELKYEPPKETNERIYLENILNENPPENLFINREDILIEKELPKERQLKPIRVGIVNKGGQGERIYSPLGHAITLSAYGGGIGARTGLYYINGRVRRLSIEECKRLMGFGSDHFVSKGYQQLGNAVIPQMISNVYHAIKCNNQ
ncbi:MAG: DNA cytosine methyltransferase [Wolbachia endosymbiont of Tyrophagus putrescentiae]|nr:DNA cytosine methyltransferase [Wolbachia endosymbiont of Tyrophagus putrescentiae]